MTSVSESFSVFLRLNKLCTNIFLLYFRVLKTSFKCTVHRIGVHILLFFKGQRNESSKIIMAAIKLSNSSNVVVVVFFKSGSCLKNVGVTAV